jgi:hypothetical protein
MNLSNLNYAIRYIIALLIIALVVSLGVGLLFMTQKLKDTMNRQFPEVDCDVLTKSYFGQDMLEHYALLEYHNMREVSGGYESGEFVGGIPRETLLKLSTSNLQCYCDNLQDEIGYNTAMHTEFDLEINDDKYQAPVCKQYLRAKYWMFMGIFLIPIILELINMSITEICEV